jgi:outer membrane protein assembly factor BamB
VFGDTVIFSGLKKGTEAYRPKHSDTGWTIERIWHNEDESIYMSSPVLTDALLFGFAHTQKGHFFCLNAQNGKRLWQSEGRQSDQAAIISAGNVLLCQNSEGELIVIRKNLERFDPIAQYQVANSPTWAPPTLIDGHLLVKDASHLTLWRLQ